MNELVPFDGQLQMIVRHSPFERFHGTTKIIPFEFQSIEDIVRDHLPSSVTFTCALSGKIIQREDWPLTFVSARDSILFTPVLHGSNPTKTIIGAILIIVAVVLMCYAPYGTGIWAKLAEAGIAMIAAAGVSLLVTGLMPVVDVPTEAAADKGSITSWSPQTTQKLGGCIPRYYGTHKVVGNIIASNLENKDDQQYIYALICLGFGPYQKLYDFKLNDIPAEQLKQVRIQTRRGLLTQATLPGFEDTTREYPYSQKLLFDTPFTIQTAGDNFDKLKVHFLFPSGLGYATDSGGLADHSVKLQVKVKHEDDTDWTVIPDATEPTVVQEKDGGYWIRGYEIETQDERSIDDGGGPSGDSGSSGDSGDDGTGDAGGDDCG